MLNFKIGADFSFKLIDWDANTQIRLQFWDIAGTQQQQKY